MDMRILITEWALGSYTEMVGRDFTDADYWTILRPDIERLFNLWTDVKFRDSHFWGPAESGPNATVQHGFKMKWRGIGAGEIQLRLSAAILDDDIWLCHAWSKTSPQMDDRRGQQLKARIPIIQDRGASLLRGEIHDRST